MGDNMKHFCASAFIINPETKEVIAGFKKIYTSTTLEEAKLIGTVTDVMFKGVHFEVCANVGGMEFVIHTYEIAKVGEKIGLSVDPYEIHLMKVNE